jgi:hypothetical protein
MFMPSIGRTPLALCAAAITIVACSRQASQPKVPLGQAPAPAASHQVADPLPPAARGALDQGNQRFRAGQYEAALASYREAAKAAPSEAAPYFGVLMVAQKLGNKALADSASKAIAARDGDQQMLTDSSMRALHNAKPE